MNLLCYRKQNILNNFHVSPRLEVHGYEPFCRAPADRSQQIRSMPRRLHDCKDEVIGWLWFEVKLPNFDSFALASHLATMLSR